MAPMAIRQSRNLESTASSLPLLPTIRDACADSVYSDDLGEEKVEPDSPSKPSFRISELPVSDSFQPSAHARQTRPSVWRRLSYLLSHPFKPRWSCSNDAGNSYGSSARFDQTFSHRPKSLRRIAYLCLILLVMLGIVQLFALGFGIIAAFFPEDIHSIVGHWGQVGRDGEGLDHWPTDFTRDIVPIACHSHNDYWRKVPLYSAISAGCIGIEADVWLFDEELYVGHSTSSLSLNRTLRNLYINPLVDILDRQNPLHKFHPNASEPLSGIFDVDPSQTVTLLIDFKTSGPTAFPYVVSQLAPLRERGYLTYFNGHTTVEGPLTVVATGNAPFDSIIRNTTYRDVFFDAPLKEMDAPGRIWADLDMLSDVEIDYQKKAAEEAERGNQSFKSRFIPQDKGQGSSGRLKDLNPDVYSPQNSYYASVSLSKAIGHIWRHKLSTRQMDLIRNQVRGAHRRGLKARYWNLPRWPIGLRNQVWEILVEEGVDLLNVDDLQSAAKKDWSKWKGWWGGKEKKHMI